MPPHSCAKVVSASKQAKIFVYCMQSDGQDQTAYQPWLTETLEIVNYIDLYESPLSSCLGLLSDLMVYCLCMPKKYFCLDKANIL